ncbi:hypothetical protein PFICI_12865 [Pestalotiopsis fici W106-1]|uniref:Nephrocystin 3-like N-terminal domain-containing protein n=1 Tax=Pestalotiopsis fici (strain W106-1 / CGMCC3.15140) TaxID=1229662 RepID=W3WSW4_PESFW|nr:uncharacterized protein PFICI_12865 [Pestalotiopsis fici W106-1]ETS75921.1 hypothetical protein PFICI_12865 [Pestalotiopsis fici W106-1]
MATHHHLNFRLRGIPTRYETRIDVRELVKSVLSIEPGASVIIHSLVDNPIEPDSQVATLSFHTLPADLSDGSKNEWSFSLPTDDSSCEDEFSRMDYLVFDTHFTGFTPLQHTKAENCHVNLIAISGLGGHAFGSFKERGGPFMWLRDVLPFDFPGARILIYGYDTQIEQSVSFQNLADLGKALGIDLRSLRVLEENAAIVFIGHSLGGLVIKEAMTNLHEAMNKQSASILHSVSGFCFFGVPHQGMAIESLVPLVMNNPNRSLLESLNKNSALLQSLERDFSNLFVATKPEIFSFYETEKSPTAIKTEKGKWELCGPPEVLVDVSSATCGCNERYPINRNHSELVKYHNRHDGCYVRVRSVLEPLLGKESRLAFESKKAEHSESLRSLSFREQESRYLEIHTANETCEWLLQEPQYQTWMNKSHGLFWIKGNPGAGKSVLMKFALDEMKRRQSGEVVASFFIHGRGVLLQKTPAGVLRALLSSILEHFPADLSRVTQRFKDYQRQFGSYVEGRWDWTQKELEDFMSYTLTKGTMSPATVIFIDALDECGENYARGLFAYFKNLMEVVERKGGQVKICISSRHYPILGLNTIPTISVEERNDTDIRFVVQELLREIQPRAKRQEVEKQILLKAQGGFLWAILVTQRVIHNSIIGTKNKKLFEQLTVTPETLNELYTDILKDTAGKERLQMIKLFQWVLFAERPLSSQELREAIATDRDMTCATVSQLRDHDSWIESLNQFEIHIKHITKGLVAFETRDLWEHFLQQHGPSLHANQTPTGAGHFEISRSCLRYIMLSEVLEATQLSRSLLCATFPLLPYMIRFFFHHIRKVEQEGILQTDLLPLLWDEKAGPSDKIARLWRTLDPESAHTPNGWPYIGATPLHVLVALGSRSAFETFLQENPEVDGRDLEGNTPLLLAIRESHLDMALMLVNRSVDWKLRYANGIDEDIRRIDNTDNRKSYVTGFQLDGAIYFVVQELSYEGKDDVLETFLSELLIAGANTCRLMAFNATSNADTYYNNVNNEDEDDDAILLASRRGQASTVSTLLIHGVSATYQGSNGQTPLDLALAGGHLDIIRLLLEKGVDQNALCNKHGQIPLELALGKGQFDVARLLFEMGADPNALALGKGQLDVARLLLEMGADLNAISSSKKQTLLQSALNNGYFDKVELLLEMGADLHAVNNKDRQALLYSASAAGYLEAVRLLLDKGADPNATQSNKDGRIPLYAATTNRHIKVVQLLLEKGAKVDASGYLGRTPLYSACANGHIEIARSLIEKGASLRFLDGYKRTALELVVANNHFELVALLVEMGANPNVRNDLGRTLLNLAAGGGRPELVERLLRPNYPRSGRKDAA